MAKKTKDEKKADQNWGGLWRHEGEFVFFSSPKLLKKDLLKLPLHTQIIVRKNKFYRAGSNPPLYQFTFGTSEYLEHLEAIDPPLSDEYPMEDRVPPGLYVPLGEAIRYAKALLDDLDYGMVGDLEEIKTDVDIFMSGAAIQIGG